MRAEESTAEQSRAEDEQTIEQTHERTDHSIAESTQTLVAVIILLTRTHSLNPTLPPTSKTPPPSPSDPCRCPTDSALHL